MGTRFMCTIEAPIHQNIKEAIVNAQETDTALVLRRWKNTTRLFKNKVTEEALKVEKESKDGKFEEIAPFVSGKRGRQVFLNGDPNFGVRYLPLHACTYTVVLTSDRFGLRVRSLDLFTTSPLALNSSRGSRRKHRQH